MTDPEWRLTDLREHFSLAEPIAAAPPPNATKHSTSTFCSAVDAITEVVPPAVLLARLQLQDRVESVLAPPGTCSAAVDWSLALEAMRSDDPEAHAAKLMEGQQRNEPCCLSALATEREEHSGVDAELARLVQLEAAAARACLQMMTQLSTATPVRHDATPGDTTAIHEQYRSDESAVAASSEAFRAKYTSLRERERALVAARTLLAHKEADVLSRDERVRAVAAANARKAASLRVRESRVLAAERALGLVDASRGHVDAGTESELTLADSAHN